MPSDLHDLQHLITADVAVAVQVVHAEGPFQLLLQFTPWCHTQSDDELPEIDGAIVVGVKRAEYMLSKLRRITIGKEVGIDLLKFLHVQMPTGAVFQEPLFGKNIIGMLY